ncbi:MAG: outer membrane beta-barrel protein [Bacteroidota bacterium]
MKPINILIATIILAYASINANAQNADDTVKIQYKGKQWKFSTVLDPNEEEMNKTIRLKDSISKKNIVISVSASQANGFPRLGDSTFNWKKQIIDISKNKDDGKVRFIETHLLPNLDLGFASSIADVNNATATNPKFIKSVNLNLGLINQSMNLYKGRFLFSYGIGLNNYYLKYQNKQMVQYIDPQGYLASYVDTVNNYDKNRLNVKYYSIPLMLEYHSKNKNFNIAAGVEYSFSGRTSVVTKGDKGSNEFKRKEENDIKINPTQINAVVKVGIDNVALYARYTITDMHEDAFTEATNPHYHLFSVGLCLMGI